MICEDGTKFFALVETEYISQEMNDISTEISASSGMENCVRDLTSLAEGASLCGPWCPTSGITHWVHIEYKRFWRFTGVQLNITKTNVWAKFTSATAEVFVATTSHQLEFVDTLYPDNNTVRGKWACLWNIAYRKVSNIRRIKFQN